MNIHPTAMVDPAAKLGAETMVGPHSTVENNVITGSRGVIGPHAVIRPHG